MTTTRERALEVAARSLADLAFRHMPGGYQAEIEAVYSALALPPSPQPLPCGCFNHDGGPYAPDCEAVYGEERAALNAAAPDMLAALQAFLRAPSIGSDGPGSLTIVVQEFNLRAARAAIARATGQEG